MWRSGHEPRCYLPRAPKRKPRAPAQRRVADSTAALASGVTGKAGDGRLALPPRIIDASNNYCGLALHFCREIQSERYHFPAAGKLATKLRQNDTPILSAGAASLIV
jgi:hypothetical protein